MTAASDDAAPIVTGATVRGGSVARLLTEGSGAVLALITGAVIARRLGPGGKGTASTLNYLLSLLAALATLGLGDAVAIMVGRGRAAVNEAAEATMWLLLVVAPVSVAALWLASPLFGDDWQDLQRALVATSVALPLVSVGYTVALLTEATHRLVFAAAARAVVPLVTAGATVALVGFGRGGVAASVMAVVLGWTAGTLLLVGGLRATGTSLRPRYRPAYLREALRYGVPIQLSFLLVVLAARVDLLLVNALLDDEHTGLYSVALTLGQLVGYPATALAAASYPRLALLDDQRALELFGRVVRAVAAASLVSAVALLPIIPIVTPLAFGKRFQPAVGPGLLLVASGVLVAVQWVVCRALSARADRSVVMRSYGLSVLVMAVGDVLLIPTFGLMGAAAASVVSAAAGLVVAVAACRRQPWLGFHPSMLLPRWNDLVELLKLGRRLSQNPS